MLADLSASASSSAKSALEKLEGASKTGDVGAALGAVAEEFSRAKDSMSARLESLSVAEAVGMLGLDARFIESEVRAPPT